jgi:dTDP-4-amino-4,6-dideoxygalactose transaminase
MYFESPRIVKISTIDGGKSGAISVIESSKSLPFVIKRVYYIYGCKAGNNRGFHAHKKLRQCFVVVNGSVTLRLEGQRGMFEYRLSSPAEAVLIPPGYWREMSNFSKDTVIMVLASDDYHESDYIRDYNEFKFWMESLKTVASVPYLDFERYHDLIGKELEHAAIQVIRSNSFIGGVHKRSFERQFAEFCGVRNAIGVGNGLEALGLILEGLDVGLNDEVIVCAAGFVATPLAISRCKAIPVFVDCDSSGNIDPRCIEGAITRKTKAILLTHLYGFPASMNQINSIAKRHKLYVVEDSCQAHGALYDGKRCGSLATAAAFSFYPTKNLGGYGDGGCITTDDDLLAEKIGKLANYGSVIKYHHEFLGTNSRLDELQAALLAVKLPYVDEWNAKRRDLAAIYSRELADIAGLTLPSAPSNTVPVWHVYAVRVKSGLRDALASYLSEMRIGTNIHYPKALHLQQCYESRDKCQKFVEAESQAAEVLSLPLDAVHTEAEILFICSAVRKFFENHAYLCINKD